MTETPSLLSDRLDPVFGGFMTLAMLLGYLDIAKEAITGDSMLINWNSVYVLVQAAEYVIICYILCFASFITNSQILTCLIWISWPIIFVNHNQVDPVMGGIYAGYGVAIGLKMISFVMFGKKSTIKSFLYFLIAPTLCYQPSYQRAEQVNIRSLLSFLSQFILCCHILKKIITQILLPKLSHLNSLQDQIDISMFTVIAWIVGFYGYFHCYMNLIAELVMFKDRQQFYNDWWNAESVQEFWRKWNVPMHKWFKTHITATRHQRIVVFLLSAVMHEYLVFVPTRRIHVWPMLAILSQYPLISASQVAMSNCQSKTAKNAVNWLLLLIFGPLTMQSVIIS